MKMVTITIPKNDAILINMELKAAIKEYPEHGYVNEAFNKFNEELQKAGVN